MTQDEIIELARQVGFFNLGGNHFDCTGAQIKDLVELVAAKERDRMCEQCNWSKHENAACNEANKSKVLG